MREPFTGSATVSGNSAICTSGNYTVSGVLEGQTLTWSLSNTTTGTLSTTTGATTTLTKTGGGEVILNARITNSCGQFYDVSKNITIGIAGVQARLFTNSGYPYNPYSVPENCESPFWLFTTSSQNLNENDPDLLMKFTCNGVSIIKSVDYGFAILRATDFNIQPGQAFNVFVAAGNNCGFAITGPRPGTGFTLYRPTLCECGSGSGCNALPIIGELPGVPKELQSFRISPNPSSEFLNIELKSSLLNLVTLTQVYATLYDMSGVVKQTLEITNNLTTLNLSSLTQGLYVLKIEMNGMTESHQVVVQ